MTQSFFDLNLLRVAVAVADAGSVSGAARRLGLSQPATSAALARLRAAVGDALFVKTNRGMDPTPRGVSLIATAREVIQLAGAEVGSGEAFDPATTQACLTLALSDVGEMVFLPRLLDYLRRHAPGATLRSVAHNAEDIERGLTNGRIDLAVGYFPDLKRHNFYQQRLFSHHFSCLVRSAHPSVGESLSVSQFLELGHAVVRAEGRSQELVEAYLKRVGLARRIVVETPHFMSLPTLIARSDLIATVPHALGLYLQQSSARVRIVPPPLPFPRFDLKQHWHRKYHQDPKRVWLRNAVTALFDDRQDEWRDG